MAAVYLRNILGAKVGDSDVREISLGSDVVWPIYYLSTVPQNLSWARAGGSESLQIQANQSWEITSKPSWLTISALSGSGNTTLTVTATMNPTLSIRSGNIVVTPYSGNAVTVAVTQAAGQFSVSPLTYAFAKEGGTVSLQLATSADWKVKSKPSWITVDRSSGTVSQTTIVATAPSNVGGDYRNGSIIFCTQEDESITASCSLSQAEGDKISISPTAFTRLSGDGYTGTLHIYANGAWSIANSLSWVSLSALSGSGDTDITVTVAANQTGSQRSGNIYLTCGEASEFCNISQSATAAPTLIVTPASISASADGSVITLTVQSSAAWECSRISSSETWYSYNVRAGAAGTSTVIVTVNAQSSASQRTGTLRFSATQGMAQTVVDVPIVQAGQSVFIPSAIYDSYVLAVDENESLSAELPISVSTFAALEGDAQSLTLDAYVSGNGVDPIGLAIELAIYDIGSDVPSSWDDVSRYGVSSGSIGSGGHFRFSEAELPGNTFGSGNIGVALRITVGSTYYYAKLSDSGLGFQTSFCYSLI